MFCVGVRVRALHACVNMQAQILRTRDGHAQLDDVLGVREDGRRHDPRHVVREEVGGVEARVARPIPPAFPVFGTTGEKAEAPGTAAPNATERLYDQWHYLVTFYMARVVVVALVERHVPLACVVVKGAVPGRAALGATLPVCLSSRLHRSSYRHHTVFTHLHLLSIRVLN